MKNFLLLIILMIISTKIAAVVIYPDQTLMLGSTSGNVNYSACVSGSPCTKLSTGLPALRYNNTSDKWELSHDGTNFFVISGLTDTAAFLNKTIDADLNSISNIANANIKSGAAIDASKIADGSVSSTEFQRLDGVTSSIQTQINSKQGTLTNSAGLAAALSDETGTGLAVFSASPAFSGNPTVPTQAANNNSTRIASTAYVDTADALKANLASPTFTGTPSGPTAVAGTSTTQLATTAFVTTADNLKANIASPTFTGTVTVPDRTGSDNSGAAANTKYVDAAIATVVAGGVNEASASVKGIIKLAGDLTGTADAPLIKNAVSLNGPVTVKAQSGVASPITGTNLHVSGANSSTNYLSMDSYGNENGFFFRRANGTQASPTAVSSGDQIGGLSFRGYGATGYSSGSRALIRVLTSEAWTDSAQGTKILFSTTPSGSTTAATSVNFDPRGAVAIGKGSTDADASSILELSSTTKGLLPPRLTTTQKNAIVSPVEGLTLFDTTLDKLNVYNGTSWDSLAPLASPSFTGTVSVTGLLNTLGGWNIESSNNVIAGDSFGAGNNGKLYFGARSMMTSPADGILRLTNAAQNNFTRLQFGGTTSSFPSLKRSSTTLDARLADDSDFAPTQGLYQRFGSGTPESSVTAPVGSVYSRTDGAPTSSLYVKESGSGNTGWTTLISDSESTTLPNIRPSLLLDFANSRSLDPRITFTRSTTATRVNERGLIETVAINQPRFDHDPTTLESLGLLIEEARTNLILRSEEFDNASWSKTRLNATPVIANDTVAPNGLTTADRLVEDNTTGAHLIQQTPTIVNTTVYTLSIFAKVPPSNARTQFHLVGGATTLYGKLFDLSAGTVATDQVSGVSDATSGTIKAYPDGWYRCSITFTSDGTSGNMQVRLYNGADSYLGDNASGIYIWGAQLETGAFPTSYIPTVASSVNRTADSASMTGTNFSSWFNALEGTFVTGFNAPQADGGGVISGTSNNYWYMYRQSSTILRSFDNTNSISNTVAAMTPSTYIKASSSFSSAGRWQTVNGTDLQTVVSPYPTANNVLYIGSRAAASNYLNNTIKYIHFFPKRVSSTELQAVSR